MKLVLIAIALCALNSFTQAQVEHNFEMSPEKTDCHLLELTDSKADNIAAIKNANYRLKENLKLSRYYSPKNLDFYSCDGKFGYLIAEMQGSLVLHMNIRTTLWDSLTNTDDPIGFYQSYFE